MALGPGNVTITVIINAITRCFPTINPYLGLKVLLIEIDASLTFNLQQAQVV
jgi:hypothetical protein